MRHSYRMIFTLIAAIVAMQSGQHTRRTIRIASKRAGRNSPTEGSGEPHPGLTLIAMATSGFSRDAARAPAPVRTLSPYSSLIRPASR